MKKAMLGIVLLLFLVVVCGCKVKVVEKEVVLPTAVASATVQVVAVNTPTIVPTIVPTSIPTIVPSVTPIVVVSTATLTKTATLKPTQTVQPKTATLVPTRVTYEVEVRILGIDGAEKECLNVIFYNAEKEIVKPFEKNGNYFTFEQEPDFVQLVGSSNGKCPWESYWLRGDVNFQQIRTDVYTGKKVAIYQFKKK